MREREKAVMRTIGVEKYKVEIGVNRMAKNRTKGNEGICKIVNYLSANTSHDTCLSKIVNNVTTNGNC